MISFTYHCYNNSNNKKTFKIFVIIVFNVCRIRGFYFFFLARSESVSALVCFCRFWNMALSNCSSFFTWFHLTLKFIVGMFGWMQLTDSNICAFTPAENAAFCVCSPFNWFYAFFDWKHSKMYEHCRSRIQSRVCMVQQKIRKEKEKRAHINEQFSFIIVGFIELLNRN